MNRKLVFSFFLFLYAFAFSQEKTSFSKEEKDTLSHYLSETRRFVYEDFPKALELLEKAKVLAERSGEKEDMGNVLLTYGMVYYVRGDYEISLQNYLEAFKIFREEGNTYGSARALLGQGLIQQGIDRNREAINLFEQAIKYYKESGKYLESGSAYLNIAISEIELKKFNEARENLTTALEIAEEAGRATTRHLSWNKLGEINFIEGKFDTAIHYYNKVLQDTIEPNSWEKSFAYAGLAQSQLKQGKTRIAEENALKALSFSKKTHSLWDLERNTKILFNIYKETGETDKALNFLELNQIYKDSLYNKQKLQQINLMQLKTKEDENLRLTAEKELTEKKLFNNRVIIFLLIIVTLFLIGLLILLRKNNKIRDAYNAELASKNETITGQNQLISKQNQDLKELNQDKDRLFSILSHDLQSPIGSMQQLLEMMNSGDFSEEEKKMLLDQMLQQVISTSAMLHNLLHWANSQMEGSKNNPESLGLPPKVSKAIEVYRSAAKAKRISIVHNVPPELSKIKVDKGELMVILHNLVSNAIKFTMEGKDIKLSYHEKEDAILLKIKDGGEGISEEKIREIKSFNKKMFSEVGTRMETGTGIGLMLVKQFLLDNNANLDIKSYPGEGSEFIVAFQKSIQ